MRIFSLFLLFPIVLSATDLRPWYRNDLEPHPYVAWNPQIYDKLDTKHGCVNRDERAHFVTLGVDGSYEKWAAELEVILADTLDHDFGFDHARLTGRYQWWSDDIGDAFSLVTGITLIQAVTESVHDLSSFHHSKFEGEGHIAIGQQCFSEQFWTSRWWGDLALGLSDQGSPWMRGNIGFERNYWDWYQWQLFARSLWGFGGRDLDLDPDHNFHGYGDIQHRSVDLGGRLAYWKDCLGEISCEYAYRVYAKNFPKHVHQFRLQILYPFGL